MNAKLIEAIEEAEEFLKETKEIFVEDREKYLSNKEKIYATSMTLFTTLNALIEIGEEVITIEKLKSAHSYQDIFIKLFEKNIISEESVIFLKASMKDRNMIAHQYGEFKREKVYDLIKNSHKIEQFISEIKKYYKDKIK